MKYCLVRKITNYGYIQQIDESYSVELMQQDIK